MKNVEKAIQAAAIHWIRKEIPNIIITTTANERSYKETNQIGSIGIPDLILFKKGICVLFLELKRKNGTLSDSQKTWNADFDLHYASDNCKRAVAYGFDEAKEIIRAWAS